MNDDYTPTGVSLTCFYLILTSREVHHHHKLHQSMPYLPFNAPVKQVSPLILRQQHANIVGKGGAEPMCDRDAELSHHCRSPLITRNAELTTVLRRKHTRI